MSLLDDIFGALGGVGAVVTLEPTYAAAGFDGGGGTAFASFELQSDGDVVLNEGLGDGDVGDWVNPKSAAPGSYEVRATLVSGTLASGTTGSWLALTTSRSWSVFQSGPGSAAATLTVEIRIDGVVQDTTTVTLSADVF